MQGLLRWVMGWLSSGSVPPVPACLELEDEPAAILALTDEPAATLVLTDEPAAVLTLIDERC